MNKNAVTFSINLNKKRLKTLFKKQIDINSNMNVPSK